LVPIIQKGLNISIKFSHRELLTNQFKNSRSKQKESYSGQLAVKTNDRWTDSRRGQLTVVLNGRIMIYLTQIQIQIKSKSKN